MLILFQLCVMHELISVIFVCCCFYCLEFSLQTIQVFTMLEEQQKCILEDFVFCVSATISLIVGIPLLKI